MHLVRLVRLWHQGRLGLCVCGGLWLNVCWDVMLGDTKCVAWMAAL